MAHPRTSNLPCFLALLLRPKQCTHLISYALQHGTSSFAHTLCALLQLDSYAEVAVCPHPGRCTHRILPALQLDSNQRCQNFFCHRPCRYFMPCVPQLDSHAEVSRAFGPGPRGHLMPCVLQLDSDAEVSDSLGMGTEGASQSHTAPYSQTPADSLGAARGQDDRDYHPVLGDDVTSRGAGKRAYGTRSKGWRVVRRCPRARVVLAAVMLVSIFSWTSGAVRCR